MALAVPVTVKTTEEGENERLDYAVSAMQGYRVNVEDAHAIVLNLDATTGTPFFGVYDGHGGPAVSEYYARHLHTELRRHERFRDNLRVAFEKTFLRMDEMMRDRSAGRELSGYGGNEDWEAYRKALCKSRFLPFCQKLDYLGPQNDGCTACAVLIRGNQIIVGNAGDSRCVLSRNDLAIDLSNDFKPSLPAERERTEAAGHEVTFSERGNVHRIDDGIAISRSLGDLRYKDNNSLGPQEQAITGFPEVNTFSDWTNSGTRKGVLKFNPKLQQKIMNVEKALKNCAVRFSIFSNAKRTFSTSTINIGSLFPEMDENDNEFTELALDVLEELLQEADEEVPIENYAVVSLDGTNKEVLRSYVLAVIKFRLWNQLRGSCLDVSSLFNSQKWLYSTPPCGTFHFVVKYNGEALDLPFDGKESWLKSVLKVQEGSFQFKPAGFHAYIPSKKCHILPFAGRYKEVAPDGNAGDIPLGVQNLKIAFRRAMSSDGKSESLELNLALGTFIVYFGESPKFHKVFRACASSLVDAKILSLNCYDPTLGDMVRFWGSLSKILLSSMLDGVAAAHNKAGFTHAKVPGVAAVHNQFVDMNKIDSEIMQCMLPRIKCLQDILDNICFFNYNSMRATNPATKKYVKLPKKGSVVFHPIEPSLVNAEDTCVTELRVKCHEMLGIQYQLAKPRMDTEVCPILQNAFVKDFLNRNRVGVFHPNTWASDVVVKKHHSGLSVLKNLASTAPSRSFSAKSLSGLPIGTLAELAKRGLNMLKVR